MRGWKAVFAGRVSFPTFSPDVITLMSKDALIEMGPAMSFNASASEDPAVPRVFGNEPEEADRRACRWPPMAADWRDPSALAFAVKGTSNMDARTKGGIESAGFGGRADLSRIVDAEPDYADDARRAACVYRQRLGHRMVNEDSIGDLSLRHAQHRVHVAREPLASVGLPSSQRPRICSANPTYEGEL
ncbi:hypothetical protein [Bordetella sp. H567]|uniref:hypothetical protein n=1 Tax=Bordetella sp. H567 TaxID=1697043 RepID=UPI0011AB7EA6|nr:hypothetical protein [Bordetella sp. H567]